MQNALLSYIQAENEKTRAWIAAGPNRWASLITEDLTHWASYNIHTPEELQHYFLVCDVYEMTRDAYGYKPNWAHLDSLTNDELRAEGERLSVAVRDAIEAEEAWERAAKETERLATEKLRRITTEAFTRREFTLATAFAIAGL